MFSYAKKYMVPLLAAGGAMGLSTGALAGLSEGDMAVKIGGAYIVPDESSIEWRGNGTISKSKLKKDTNPFTAGIDLLVMATDDIGINFGTSWPAKIKQKGTDSNGDRFNYEYELWPWHATLQYYFMKSQDEFRPYVGAGLHYSNLDKFKLGSQKVDKIDFDNEYGFLLQFGGIFNIDDNMFVDASARYFYLEPDGKAKIKFKSGDPTFKGKVKDYKINPWMFNISFGLKI